MAIVAGDQVALIRNPSSSTLQVSGSVLFGIVFDTSSNNKVAWENGQVAEGIPSAQLDKISPEVPTCGQAVAVFTDSGGVASPEYRCVAVRGYTRQPAGAGSAASFVLLRSLSTGQLYETPSDFVETVDGV